MDEAVKRPVLLLVEDDEFTRHALAEILRLDGWEVITATDGADGLAKVAGGDNIDIIVTDVMMPRLDGLEMLRRVRALGRTTPPCAIIVSAVDVPAEALQPGDVYLKKPIDVHLLETTLEHQVYSRH